MSYSIFTFKLLPAILLSACLGVAQQPPAGRRMAMPGYDPSTEITIKGTVESVQQLHHGRMSGIHLTVKTAEQSMEVRLGPSSFLASKQFAFVKGDEIEVRGSKVTLGGKETLIAREVVKGGKTLTLRDKNGKPVWSGGNMQNGAAAGMHGCCMDHH